MPVVRALFFFELVLLEGASLCPFSSPRASMTPQRIRRKVDFLGNARNLG